MANTTTVKKITKAQRNEDIIAMLQGKNPKYGTTVDEAVKHLTHENDLLSRKNSSTGKKKLTKDQEANLGYKQEILAYLRSNPSLMVTANDIMSILAAAHPQVLWSNQKAASLLNAMSDKKDKETGEIESRGLLEKVDGRGKTKTTWQIKPEVILDADFVEEEDEDLEVKED